MQKIIGIQFKQSGKSYYFDPNGVQYSVGDGCIVETARGVEYGKVVIANKEVEDSQIVGQLKKAIRKATAKDTEIHNANLAKHDSVLKQAREKIIAHQLDMKLVDVEFAFDNSKILFLFTAEGRIDFRELVKDLASTFKNRIELRQIGIRDECKQKGGLGPCGRACCCSAYMADFERVSIKMAKNQGLSLNPTKISGLCGRLMCCLKFEDDYYAQTIKFMPKIGATVGTIDGKGIVVVSDILRQTVNVRLTLPNGDMEIKTFSIKDVTTTKNDPQGKDQDSKDPKNKEPKDKSQGKEPQQ